MTLEDAFKKMIQNYFDDDEEDTGTLKPKKYDKKYLDALHQEVTGKKKTDGSKDK